MTGDATSVFQKCITEGCKKRKSLSDWVKIKVEEGSFPITVLRIPEKCKVALFSEKISKIVHIGQKKKPLFILGEKSF